MKHTSSYLLALMLATIIGLAACDNDKPKMSKIAPPTGTAKTPQGLHALNVSAGPEPFSKADVTAYFQTHNLPRNLASNASIQVESVEFMSSSDVSSRLAGERTGLADSARLGFVTLTGEFLLTGPSGSHVARFTRAYAAFDASSGNLLMVGTLPEASDNNNANAGKKPRG